MKKIIAIFSLMGLLALSAMPLMAKTPKSPADYNGLNKGKSEVNHLYLYEKDSSTWEIVEDGAWGKMMYKADNFVFNGHGLEAEIEYTLINYARNGSEWPPTIHCLGAGMATENGNVHIKGNLGELEYDTTPNTGNSDGYKIWLVPATSADCAEEKLIGWDPAEYLFEYNVI